MKILTGNSTVVASPLFANATGTAVNADTLPTVDVTSDHDQTIAVSAVSNVAAGSYSVTVDPLDEPDLLTFTWEGEVDGNTVTLTDQIEVAGGTYLSLVELANLRDLDASKHSLALRVSFRDEFEDIAERWTGQAWVPRYARERLPYCTHLLGHLAPRSILAVADGDDAVVDFADWLLEPWGLLTSTLGNPVLTGTWPYTVRYLHGADRPPVDLKNACADYVRAKCLAQQNRTGRDVLSQTDPSGIGTQWATPDWSKGRPTGYLDIDRVLTSLGAPLPGIA